MDVRSSILAGPDGILCDLQFVAAERHSLRQVRRVPFSEYMFKKPAGQGEISEVGLYSTTEGGEMESVEEPLRIVYTVYSTVKRVEEVFQTCTSYKNEKGEYETIKESLGWFVNFDGSWESICFGGDRPQFNKGDKIKITFERIEDDQPI